jgi:hypothetical protein
MDAWDEEAPTECRRVDNASVGREMTAHYGGRLEGTVTTVDQALDLLITTLGSQDARGVEGYPPHACPPRLRVCVSACASMLCGQSTVNYRRRQHSPIPIQ